MKTLRNLLGICLLIFIVQSCATAKIGGGINGERQGYGGSERALISKSMEKPGNQTRASNTSTSSEAGFYVGLALTGIEVADNLSFQPEANFVIIKDRNQINVPLLLSYEIADGFSAQLGPSFGILLDAPDFLNSFNFGADGGLNYMITDALGAHARYNLGISNLQDGGDSDNFVRFSNFLFGLSYSLDFLNAANNND